MKLSVRSHICTYVYLSWFPRPWQRGTTLVHRHNARLPGSGQSAVGGTGAGLSDHRATCVTAESWCGRAAGIDGPTWVMATYKIADCTRYIPYPISHMSKLAEEGDSRILVLVWAVGDCGGELQTCSRSELARQLVSDANCVDRASCAAIHAGQLAGDAGYTAGNATAANSQRR
jgi:hypothetical protein